MARLNSHFIFHFLSSAIYICTSCRGGIQIFQLQTFLSVPISLPLSFGTLFFPSETFSFAVLVFRHAVACRWRGHAPGTRCNIRGKLVSNLVRFGMEEIKTCICQRTLFTSRVCVFFQGIDYNFLQIFEGLQTQHLKPLEDDLQRVAFGAFCSQRPKPWSSLSRVSGRTFPSDPMLQILLLFAPRASQ